MPETGNTKIEVASLEISKQDFLSLPSFVQTFFVDIDLCVNDIALFAVMWLQYANSHSQAVADLQGIITTRKLICIRHLASKIHEMRKRLILFDKEADRLGSFSQTRAFYTENRKIYFNKKYLEMAEWIRNKVTNHFLGQDIVAFVENFPDHHHFGMIVHKLNINSVSALGEEIAFFGKANERGWSIKELGKFETWALEASFFFINLRQKFIIDVNKECLPHLVLQQHFMDVKPHDVGDLGRTCMPTFYFK